METTFRQEGTRLFLARHVYVLLLCLAATFPSACSLDASKLRASRALDGAIDQPADAHPAPAGTPEAMEVGQVDWGATAGRDATLGQDGQDSSGAKPETEQEHGSGDAFDGAIDSAGAADQAPLPAGSDVALCEDGQDSSSANPETALDGAIDDSAGAADQASAPAWIDAALGQDGECSGGVGPETGLDRAIDDWAGATDQAPAPAGSDAAPGRDGGGASSDTNTDASTGPGIVADGTYRLTARHSGKALDVNLSATADGSSVIQWGYNGGDNQRWTLTHLGGNVYKLLGVQSGKALEVATASTADGTAVDIRSYTGAAKQQWTISALSGGYFRLTPVSSSGSALDVGGVSMDDGAAVHQWTWLGGNNYNQQWTIQALQ